MNITVKTQAEWDALPKAFKEYTVIAVHSDEWMTINNVPENGVCVFRENSRGEFWGNSSGEFRENSRGEFWGNSRGVFRENSRGVFRENSRGEFRENSRGVFRENSRGVFRENSRGEFRENSRGVFRENSRGEFWGNSSGEFRENSSGVFRENSRGEFWGNSIAHVLSEAVTITIASFAVAMLIAKCKVFINSKTATVVNVEKPENTEAWSECDGVKLTKSGKLTLFKRVSDDFKTQEGTRNETVWTIGLTLEHPNWSPDKEECGEGKYHACSFASACDEFRSLVGDRYVAIEVAIADTFFWKNGDYPHKIAFKKGKVLHECNRWGEKI